MCIPVIIAIVWFLVSIRLAIGIGKLIADGEPAPPRTNS